MRKRIVIEVADNGFIVEKYHYVSGKRVFKTLEELIEYIKLEYGGYVDDE